MKVMKSSDPFHEREDAFIISYMVVLYLRITTSINSYTFKKAKFPAWERIVHIQL